MTPRTLLLGCGVLVALVIVFILGVVIAPNIHISFGPQTTTATGATPTVDTGNTPVGTTPVSTQPPPQATPTHSGGGPTNGNGQDFTATSAPITGPAIVEWFGDASCGTFKLPAGESFTWQRDNGGHYWTYATDADVNAAWSRHVTEFNAKPFNQQHACQVDVRP